jgi:hypothetical protein
VEHGCRREQWDKKTCEEAVQWSKWDISHFERGFQIDPYLQYRKVVESAWLEQFWVTQKAEAQMSPWIYLRGEKCGTLYKEQTSQKRNRFSFTQINARTLYELICPIDGKNRNLESWAISTHVDVISRW